MVTFIYHRETAAAVCLWVAGSLALSVPWECCTGRWQGCRQSSLSALHPTIVLLSSAIPPRHRESSGASWLNASKRQAGGTLLGLSQHSQIPHFAFFVSTFSYVKCSWLLLVPLLSFRCLQLRYFRLTPMRQEIVATESVRRLHWVVKLCGQDTDLGSLSWILCPATHLLYDEPCKTSPDSLHLISGTKTALWCSPVAGRETEQFLRPIHRTGIEQSSGDACLVSLCRFSMQNVGELHF